MQILTVPIVKPDDVNVIVGQAHFIKTVEDLYEVIVASAPTMKFGIAFVKLQERARSVWKATTKI